MRLLDLFSGIGGFSLGLERTGGFKTVAFCEIDPFCRRVLAKHWPNVPCHDDVTTREFHEGEADVIVGGFPCQDISVAGRRAGLAGSRSGLYRELLRAIRLVRPRYAIVENVANLLNNGMGTILGDLAEIGADAEWDCVPASAVGAPHERDRAWIVAHAAGDRPGWGEAPEWASRNLTPRGAEAGDRRNLVFAASAVAHPSREQVGHAGQPRFDGRVVATNPDAVRIGRGQGRERRPPDSFARVRDEARRNAADLYGARLAFREGITRDAWEEREAPQRDGLRDGGQSIWPDEPALSGVDDGVPHWMDRVKATGNTIVPQIAELIGRGILAAEETAQPSFREDSAA